MKIKRFFIATVTYLIINALMLVFLTGLFDEYNLHYIGWFFGCAAGFVGRPWIQDLYEIGMSE